MVTPEERLLALRILADSMSMLSNLFSSDKPRMGTGGTCCDACSSLSTGQCGIPYFEAATQTWKCLVVETGKILGGGINGDPIWVNAANG